MNCRHVNLGGQPAIICGDFHDLTPKCQCGGPGEFMCDWKLSKGTPAVPGATCDRRICAAHAKEVAPQKHLCPEHQGTYARWQAQRVARRPGGAS